MKLRKYINIFRLWLLKILFTKNEKYLLIRAIEDRINNLEKIKINEKWINNHDATMDIYDYSKMKTIFSTKDWN